MTQQHAQGLTELRSLLNAPAVAAARNAPAAPAAAAGSAPADRPPIAGDTARIAQLYLEALRTGDRRLASQLILTAVESWDVPIKRIYLDVMQPTQYEVGRLWESGAMSIAEEHYCTAATQLVISQLYPYLFTSHRKGQTMVATSVSGELHELGARMVADFFEMDGWDTIYLGANTPPADVLHELKHRDAGMLCVSATMTSSMNALAELIACVRSDSDAEGTRILVGGYPFTQDSTLWRRVGADGTARSADDAVTLANNLVSKHAP